MRVVRLLRWLILVTALIALAAIARPYVHGASFVVRAAEMDGRLRRIADVDAVAVQTRELSIPTRRGPMRARLYEPAGSHTRAAVLTSALHASGIDEPRLVRPARQLAGSHIAIVTPDIPHPSHVDVS